jgi:molybdate-binding protein
LGIRSLADVTQTKARLINRQRGSGTHLALDKMLQDGGIDTSDINGYYTEEFTHLAVAAAVAGGGADVGLGIEAAARKLKVDFVPLFSEDYYLLVTLAVRSRPSARSLAAKSGLAVAAPGGYAPRHEQRNEWRAVAGADAGQLRRGNMLCQSRHVGNAFRRRARFDHGRPPGIVPV